MGDKVKKPGRSWKVLLACSLALNLAVAGLVVGAVVSGRTSDGPPRSFDLGLGPVSRALTQDERREIVRNLRDERVLRDFDLRGRTTGMIAVLTADPFDPEAMRILMEEQAARMSLVQAQAQNAFFQQVTMMTPERRAVFAAQLAEELSKARQPRTRPSGG